MTATLEVLLDEACDPLYEAVVECTEEAIVNALCMADEMRGQSDHVAPALPLDRLTEILQRYRQAFSPPGPQRELTAMRICFVVADVRDAAADLQRRSTWRWPRTAAATTCASSPSTTYRFSTTTTCWRRPRACAPATTPSPADYARALASDEAVVEEDTLGSFDVVFLRYNPIREGVRRPGAPLIDFGWRLRLAGTLVVNDPEGLRRAGSRMYLADFPRRRPHAHAGLALEDAAQGLPAARSTARRCSSRWRRAAASTSSTCAAARSRT